MNHEKTEQMNLGEMQEIDKVKLNRIIKMIVELENENVKTREFNDDSMKKKIDKIIEEEVKCC